MVSGRDWAAVDGGSCEGIAVLRMTVSTMRWKPMTGCSQNVPRGLDIT